MLFSLSVYGKDLLIRVFVGSFMNCCKKERALTYRSSGMMIPEFRLNSISQRFSSHQQKTLLISCQNQPVNSVKGNYGF